MNLFRKIFFILSLFLLNPITHSIAKKQENHEKDIDGVISYFNQKILIEEFGKHSIVVTTLDAKRVNSSLHFFWKIVSDYFHTTDSQYLNEMIGKSPSYKAVKDTNSGKISFLALNMNALDHQSLNQISINSYIIEISNLVFSANGQKCLITYHIFNNGGNTVEFTRTQEGKWAVTANQSEYLE